jgi:pilus assembly protein CpaE
MGTIRVIVYNADESYRSSLRNMLMSFDNVRIAAEIDEPAMLQHVAEQTPAELLLLHLDPDPEAVLPFAAQVVASNPKLPIFALSECTDGHLILSAMRQGFREFLTKPIDRDAFAESLGKIAIKAEEDGVGGKMIALMGTSGGVGATSIATNLAIELSQICTGRVTLVDLDYRFGQVATLLDVAPTYTIADLAHSPERLENQTIERALVRHSTGISVLSRPAHFGQSDSITAAHCVGVLTNLLSMNEYVIVDGPIRYDVGASAILDLADYTFLVVQLIVPVVRNAQRILQGMAEAGFNLERIRLLCNRVGKDAGPLDVDDLESTLDKKVFATLPDDWPAMSSSVNLGEPLIKRAPKSKLRLAIQDLARNIHEPIAEKTAPSAKKGTLLSKIFSDA